MNLINLFRNERDSQLYAVGETIFSEGDIGDRLYIVLDGKITLSVGNTPVETIEPGGMFGEMALIDTEPRSATCPIPSWCQSTKNGLIISSNKHPILRWS